MRYWNGVQWTEHVVTNHVQALDPLVQSTPPSVSTADPFINAAERTTQAMESGMQSLEARLVSFGQTNIGRNNSSVREVSKSRGETATTAKRSDSEKVDTEKSKTNRKARRQVRKAKVSRPTWVGDGTLLNTPILVINQKPKIWEKHAEYSVYDHEGRQLGSVREYGYNPLNKLNPLHDEQNRKRRLRVFDNSGDELLHLTQPKKRWIRSTMILERPDGSLVGEIVEQGVIDSWRGQGYELVVNDEVVGYIDRTSAYRGFRIIDASENEIATVTREWPGMMKATSTKADNYVLVVHHPLDSPLSDLVVMAALAFDFSSHQQEPSRNSAKVERRYRRWFRD